MILAFWNQMVINLNESLVTRIEDSFETKGKKLLKETKHERDIDHSQGSQYYWFSFLFFFLLFWSQKWVYIKFKFKLYQKEIILLFIVLSYLSLFDFILKLLNLLLNFQ